MNNLAACVCAMQVIEHHDAQSFAERVRPLLLQRECENCLAIGIVESLAAPPAGSSESVRFMLSIEHQGQILAVAVQNSPIGMAVTRMPVQAIVPLAQKLDALDWPGLGLNGPVETIDLLADRWAEVTGKTKLLHHALRVFELATVVPPEPVPGKMILARPDQLDLLTHWCEAFSRTIGEPDPQPRQSTQRLIDEAQLFVWEDSGEVRSMAAVAGPTPNGIRINHVYTPPPLRGQGYAANLVAALSRHMLDSGRKFCFLFAEVSNLTANRVYQRIGYQPVADFRHWRFVDRAA